MTFERYFKVGRYAKQETDTELSVFDLFGAEETPAPRVAAAPRRRVVAPRRRCPSSAGRWYRGLSVAAVTTLSLFGTPEIAKADPAPIEFDQRWADPKVVTEPAAKIKADTRLSVDTSGVGPIGIDLVNRSHEVRKLLFAGFGGRIARRGFDPEDVLQEVYRGLLARNIGTCAFDPSKSSFGHYVHMVCGCILANYERKEGRRREHEQVGMYAVGFGDDDEGQVDAALAATSADGTHGAMFHGALDHEMQVGTEQAMTSLSNALFREGGDRPEARLAVEIMPYVYQGFQRGEIARELGLDPSKVGRALSFLRRVSRAWKVEQGFA
jgi:DNA-directed RNA polymerase specialized sigma24 family protein